MNSEELSLSSLSGEETKAAGEEGLRLRSRDHRHKHKKKHKRHSHKHKHRHKSSSRKERRHKKHRCKHRQKGSESDSEESEDQELQLIDDLLESTLKPGKPAPANTEVPAQAKERGRDVEILRAAAGNGIVESMKIVVDNRNGSKEQPVTVSSSEEEVGSMEIGVSNDENSRDMSRRAEEFCLDSSDFLHIDEDLNLEELMKQKAALQARLGAYMSDVEEEETVPAPPTAEAVQDVPLPAQKPPPPAVEKKPAQEVVTIEDSDDAEPKRKDRKKERESRPKKRKRSSKTPFLGGCAAVGVGGGGGGDAGWAECPSAG